MFETIVYNRSAKRPAFKTKHNDKIISNSNTAISKLYEIQNAVIKDEWNLNPYTKSNEDTTHLKEKTGKIKKKWRDNNEKQNDQSSSITLGRHKDIDIRNEIIYDGVHKWTPAHMLLSPSDSWWTHFLIAEDNPNLIRCKHCSQTIKFTDTSTVNKLPIVHLQTNHDISSKMNFYDKTTQETLLLNVPDLSISTSPSVLVTNKMKQSLCKSQSQNEHNIPNQLSDAAIIAVMMISQNIPLTFTENPLFTSLIEKIPENNTIHASDILDNIVNISEGIENVLSNSIPHSFPLMFNIEEIIKDQDDAFSNLKYSLEAQLLKLLHSSILSLSYNIWDNKYFIISAQYFDKESYTQKTIPLSVTQIDLSKEQINGFFISQQFQEIYNKYPGLPLSTVTITLPSEEMVKRVETENIDPFPNSATSVSNNQLRVCVLTNICKSIEYLFGNYAKGANGYNPIANVDPINALITLENVDISSSLFGKINSLYDEISGKPSHVNRFRSIYQSKNRDAPNLNRFDPHNSSSAIEFLSNFQSISDLICEMEPYLTNEKVTDNDLKVAKLLTSFLASSYSIINRLLGDSCYLPVLSLFLYHQFEKQLTSMISEIPYSRYLKQFNRSLNKIVASQESLMNIESTIMASFFVPNSLADNEFSKKIFRTTNITDILSFVLNIGSSLLKKYINTNESSYNFSKKDDDGSKDNDPLVEGLPFIEFSNATHKPPIAKEISVLESIKDILQQDVETDLTHYMKTVYSEYPKLHDNYIEANNYEEYELNYRKQGTVQILTPLQEFEFIHVPLCQDFLGRYLSSDVGLLFKVLLKIVCTETASSIRSEYLYLNNFVPAFDDELLEPCIKIKVLNEQVNINREDLCEIKLDQLCEYTL